MPAAPYDLFSWQCFAAAARCRSVRQAARDLGLDPSSVSRRIAALAESLGHPLFETSGRSLTLTPAGAAALKTYLPILKAADIAWASLRAKESRPAEFLHVIAPIGYTSTVVRGAVARFQALYPEAHFWLESGLYGGEAFERLGNGIDVIITTIERENAAFEKRELSDHRDFCFASPGYLNLHPVSRPEELARHPLAGNAQFVTAQAFTHRVTGETVPMPANFSLMSDNTNVLMDWAAGGHGILLASPYTAAAPYVNAGELAVVLPDWALPNNHVYAYAAKRDYSDPEKLVSLFIETVKKVSDLAEETSDRVYGIAGREGRAAATSHKA